MSFIPSPPPKLRNWLDRPIGWVELPYLIGERGPEIFIPQLNAEITEVTSVCTESLDVGISAKELARDMVAFGDEISGRRPEFKCPSCGIKRFANNNVCPSCENKL